MDREARMKAGARMISDLSKVLQSHDFRVEHVEGDTCLRVFFPTPCPNVIGASIAIGTDHCCMEIILWGKYNNLVFECDDPAFNDLEVINCVGCMTLRVRELSGEKKLDTTCRDCRDRRRIAEQQENEERERRHAEWCAMKDAQVQADKKAADKKAQEAEKRAREKKEAAEKAAKIAAARIISDEEIIIKVAEIRLKGLASVRTIATILKRDFDVTETQIKKLLEK